jgi:cardiolipin synthase A/B
VNLLFEILSHVGVIVGLLLGILLLSHMVRQKRSPSGTMAWLLIIVLVPYLGVPLYLILGGRKMKRHADLKADLDLYDQDVALPTEQTNLLDNFLRSYGLPGAVDGNAVALFGDGQAMYRQLIELIDSAEKTIHIATYVFHSDEVGLDVLDRLTRRCRDGVEVRLLVDGVGSHDLKKRHTREFRKAGGEVCYFNRMLSRFWKTRIDLRNHRKLIVIDGCCVIAGGANIGLEYLGPTPHEGRWKDLSFLLAGPACGVYQKIFRLDWAFASGQDLPQETDWPEPACQPGATVQIVPSGPDVPGDALYQAYISAAYAATKRLWIVTPYFIPDDTMEQAFTVAVHRGVDVRLIMPAVSNQRLTNWARGPYLRELHQAGARVEFYNDGMMHAKCLLKDDDLAVIGSANMDCRSLFLNYEVAMFAYSPGEIANLETWIDNLTVNATSGVRPVNAFRDTFEGVARLLAPLL